MEATLNQRKDILDNKTYDRDKLIRIAVQKDGATAIDREYKLGGRGIYILPSNISKAIDKKVIERQVKRFNGNFKDIEDTLKEEVNNG